MTRPRFSMRINANHQEGLGTKAKMQMICEAIALADQGVFISEDKMTGWFESLGTDHELPDLDADIVANRA